MKDYELLPDGTEYDPSSTFEETVNLIEKEILLGREFSSQVETLLKCAIYNFENKRYNISLDMSAKLLRILFDSITKIPMETYIFLEAKLFNLIVSKPKLRPSIHFSLERILEMNKYQFDRSRRGSGRRRFSFNMIELMKFISNMKFFLDESDVENIENLFLDKIIVDCECNSIEYTILLLQLYPIKCFERFLPHLIYILKNVSHKMIIYYIFDYLQSINIKELQKYNLEPYYNSFFYSLLNVINPKIQINEEINNFINEEQTLTFNIAICCKLMKSRNIFKKAGKFLSRLLYEGEEGNKLLYFIQEYVVSTKSIITPKSEEGISVIEFITFFINGVVSNYCQIQKYNNNDNNKLKLKIISKEQKEKLVQIIIPIIKEGLFTGKNEVVKESYLAISSLMNLSYDITVQEFLSFLIENMNDEESSRLSIICKNILIYMINFLMEKEHLTNNINIILKIIEKVKESFQFYSFNQISSYIKILFNICKYLQIHKNTDNYDMKIKILNHLLISTLIPITESFLITDIKKNEKKGRNEREKENDNKIDQKKLILYSKFIIYYSSFDFEIIKDTFEFLYHKFEEEDIQIENGYLLVKFLSKAHFENSIQFFFPKFIDKIHKAHEKKKTYWIKLLSGTFITHPIFEKYIYSIIELIQTFLTDKNKFDFENAEILIQELVKVLTSNEILEYRYQDKIWGQKYEEDNFPEIKWFKFDDSFQFKILNCILELLIKLKEEFNNFDINNKTNFLECLSSFDLLFYRLGKIGSIHNKELNKDIESLEIKIFEFYNNILNNSKDISIIRIVLEKLKDKFFQIIHCLEFRNKYNKIKNSSTNFNGIKPKFSYFDYLIELQLEENDIQTSYIYKFNNNQWNNIIQSIQPYLYSQYPEIRKSSIDIYSKYCYKNNINIIDEQFEIIERKESMSKFLGGFSLLNKFIIPILEIPKYTVRLFKDLILLEVDPNWEVDFNNIILNILAESKTRYISNESKEWNEFMKELPKLKSKTKDSLYSQILMFCVNQNVKSVKELTSLILNYFLNENNTLSIKILYILMTKAKPITKKILVPYSSNVILDKETECYYNFPNNIYQYQEPSIINNEDGLNEIRQGIINFLNEEGIIQKIFDILVSFHSEEENRISTIDIKCTFIWKGFTQIMKSSFIPIFKKLLDIKKQRSQTEDTAIKESIIGFSRGIKHWSFEEREEGINIILKPYIYEFFHNKQYDSSNYDVLCNIVADTGYQRIEWIFEIIIQIIKEEHNNEALFRNVLNFTAMIYNEINCNFHSKFETHLKLIEPFLNDLSKYSNNTINALSNFVYGKLLDLKSPHINSEFYNLFLKNIFMKNINHPNELIYFLSNISEYSFFFDTSSYQLCPFFSEIFQELINLDSKITLQYQNNSTSCFLYFGKFSWGNENGIKYFENIIKITQEIYPSIQWFTKLNILTFFKSACFKNIFKFTKYIYKNLLNNILPLFIKEDKIEILNETIKLQKILISQIYFDNYEEFAYETINNLKGQNIQYGIISSCSIISNIRCWNNAPEWLPILLNCIENIYYKRNKLNNLIVEIFKDFWKKHTSIHIPEIEDYRYSFSLGYFA